MAPPTSKFPNHRRPNWTKEQLIAAIKDWYVLEGEPPRANDWDMYKLRKAGDTERIRIFTDGNWPSASALSTHFGSWNAGIRAAGFTPRLRGGQNGYTEPPRKPVKFWTDQEIIFLIQQWEKEHHRPPAKNDFFSEVPPLARGSKPAAAIPAFQVPKHRYTWVNQGQLPSCQRLALAVYPLSIQAVGFQSVEEGGLP